MSTRCAEHIEVALSSRPAHRAPAGNSSFPAAARSPRSRLGLADEAVGSGRERPPSAGGAEAGHPGVEDEEGLTQEPLGRLAADLVPRRHAPRECDDLLVEERRPRLEPVRHARAIDLREDGPRHVGREVELRRERDRIQRAREPRPQRAGLSIAAAHHGLERRQVERRHPAKMPAKHVVVPPTEKALHLPLHRLVALARRNSLDQAA